MNLKQIRDDVKDILNANGQTNQDFSDAKIDKAINKAYQREVSLAKVEGTRKFFLAQTLLEWPSGQANLTLPTNLRGVQIWQIRDISSDDVGVAAFVGEECNTGTIFWRDNHTLQWGTGGPDSTRQLRFEYLAEAEKLVNDLDEPLLIPEAYQDLLVYGAAIRLRFAADEGAPPAWMQDRGELRQIFWKYVSRGRIVSDDPAIGLRATDSGTFTSLPAVGGLGGGFSGGPTFNS